MDVADEIIEPAEFINWGRGTMERIQRERGTTRQKESRKEKDQNKIVGENGNRRNGEMGRRKYQ